MPKTEIEWQELSDLLAREIMELVQVKSLYGNGELWDSKDGHEYHVALTPQYGTFYKDWKPHENVAQAMLVLKTLLIKVGRHVTAVIRIWPKPYKCCVTVHNWMYTDKVPAIYVQGPHVDTEAHAICLAAEEWLKAQKGRLN